MAIVDEDSVRELQRKWEEIFEGQRLLQERVAHAEQLWNEQGIWTPAIKGRVTALEAAMPNNAYRRKVDEGHHHNQSIEGMDDETSVGFGYQLNAKHGIEIIREVWPNHRRLTISGLGGSGPFEYDYLIDVDWATIVSAGDGSEGQSMTTFHGHSYKVYSEPIGAVDDANSNRQTSSQASSFLIIGKHSVTSSITPDPPNNGAYKFAGVVQGTTESRITTSSALSDGVFDITATRIYYFDNLEIDGGASASTPAISADGTVNPSVHIYECVVKASAEAVVSTGLAGGVFEARESHFGSNNEIAVDARSWEVISISGSEFFDGTVGLRIAGTASGIPVVRIDNCGFYTLDTVGIQIDSARRVTIQGCDLMLTSGDGILLAGNAGSSFNPKVTVQGNSISVPNGQIGINLDGGGTVDAAAWTITGNILAAGGADAVGIKGHITNIHNSLASNNTFLGFTSGKEIVNWNAQGNEAYHNISTSDLIGVTKQAMPDIGSPVGHHSSNDYYNGTFVESFTFVITEAGGVITGTLDKNPSGDLTQHFSDGLSTFSSGGTVTLTAAGADTTPTKRFVYILQSGKTTLVESTAWPATEHIKVAEVVLQTAATVGTDGPLAVRFWNDHAQSTVSQGHHTEAWERVRWEHSAYRSGGVVTWTITTNAGAIDNIDLAITAAKVYQLHLQDVSAFDTTTPADILVPNDNATPYTATADIEDLLTDSGGGSMSGKYFNLVVWCSVSSGSETERVFINLPSGSYNKQADATNDVDGHDNYTIPSDFRGYAFLVNRITLRHQAAASGTFTNIKEVDLRGQVPNIIAGGGTAAITTEFADGNFRIFDDGDPTKQVAFEASSVEPSTTRTLTVQPADGTIELVGHKLDTHPGAGSWTVIYTDGAGDVQETSLGADGQVLESQGASAAPAFSAATRTFALTAAGGAPTVTAGCSAVTQIEAGTNDNNYWVMDFDDGSDEHAFWLHPLPDNYDGGVVTFKVYWTTSATDTDGVAWALKARAYGDNEAIDQAFGTAIVVTDDAQSAAGRVLVSAASGNLTIGGTPAGGELVIWDLFRDVSDGNDDMTEDARLIAVKIEYSTNAYSD